MKRDRETYGKIADKYEDWLEIQKDKPEPVYDYAPSRPYQPEPQGDSDVLRTAFAVIGFGIGLALLALAGWAFYTAADWAGVAYNGAAIGYTLVGVFLCIAGVGGIIATWNHNFRVLARPAGHH